ncbi:MAG: Hsp20/alpha crystallin family protein [Nitriliruptor sp.]|nr:MAG: Hsp20/alpha crystallin family protein [Nitriliruptor sp.]
MSRLLPRTSLQPTRSASDVFEEFDRLRDQLLGSFTSPEARVGGWAPALADLEEKDDEFVIEVEVPGFDRDDISIEVEGRRLLVDAEREEKEREGTVRSSTRSSGHLHHEVLLPAEIDEDAIEASLDRGVLSIRLPKNAETGRRRIEIS